MTLTILLSAVCMSVNADNSNDGYGYNPVRATGEYVGNTAVTAGKTVESVAKDTGSFLGGFFTGGRSWEERREEKEQQRRNRRNNKNQKNNKDNEYYNENQEKSE